MESNGQEPKTIVKDDENHAVCNENGTSPTTKTLNGDTKTDKDVATENGDLQSGNDDSDEEEEMDDNNMSIVVRRFKLPGKPKTINWKVNEEDEWVHEKGLAAQYYEMIEAEQKINKNSNRACIMATIPVTLEEFGRTQYGLLLTKKNIHYMPFGDSIIPWDGQSMLNVELKKLKEDAGSKLAKISLEASLKNLELDSNTCAICHQKANSKCQGCMVVGYCSREHQKLHWKEHRPHCVLHEVVADPKAEDGYVLRAKTNIKKGELVLIDKPYLIIPYSNEECLNLLNFKPISDENKSMPPIGKFSVEEYDKLVYAYPIICLGCNILVERKRSVPCASCGWPTCSTTCSQLYRHHELECSYFKENKLDYEECRRSYIMIPKAFGIIRALLLKRRDLEKWNLLTTSRTFGDAHTEFIQDKKNTTLRIAVEYILVMLKTFFLFEDLTYSEVLDIVRKTELKGIYGYGSLKKTSSEKAKITARMTVVFENAALIPHRCLGNVIVVQTFPTALHVVAATAIKKGEIFYRNYDKKPELVDDLHQVLSASMSVRGVPCDCDFCAGIREDEKHVSSIICLKCKRRGFESYMVIVSPTKLETPWKCARCGSVKSWAQVIHLIENVLRDMEGNRDTKKRELYLNEITLRNQIIRYKEHVLHPDHSIIMAAECETIFLMMRPGRIEYVSAEDLEYVEELITRRIRNLSKYVRDIDSDIVALKVRLALILSIKLGRTVTPSSTDVVSTFNKLQQIYDDIASLFVENTKQCVVHDYLLMCLRHIRNIMNETGELYACRKRIMKQTERMQQNFQNKYLPNSSTELDNISDTD